ncbi:aconitase X [Bordetella sp. FB-8]|uniref:aconitase X n=1 Tax=Bordetella sp. FB-8 TaxID=1159870 RepID=UPI00350FCC45
MKNRRAKDDQIVRTESKTIAFANSVPGRRTRRYGDFLDLAAPNTSGHRARSLHVQEKRRWPARS